MFWFVTYCVGVFAIFGVGSNVLSLGWFSNSMFSFLGAGAITLAWRGIIRSWLVPRRVKKAILCGRTGEEIRILLENVWGTDADLDSSRLSPPWVESSAILAYIPFSILLAAFLEGLVHGLGLRATIAIVAAIPLVVALAKLTSWSSRQKHAWERTKQAIVANDPELWDYLATIWRDRRRRLQGPARPLAAGDCPQEARQQRDADNVFEAADQNAREMVAKYGAVQKVDVNGDGSIQVYFTAGTQATLGPLFKFGYHGTGPACFAIWLRAAGVAVSNDYVAELVAPQTLWVATAPVAAMLTGDYELEVECPYCLRAIARESRVREKGLSGTVAACPKCGKDICYPYM